MADALNQNDVYKITWVIGSAIDAYVLLGSLKKNLFQLRRTKAL